VVVRATFEVAAPASWLVAAVESQTLSGHRSPTSPRWVARALTRSAPRTGCSRAFRAGQPRPCAGLTGKWSAWRPWPPSESGCRTGGPAGRPQGRRLVGTAVDRRHRV